VKSSVGLNHQGEGQFGLLKERVIRRNGVEGGPHIFRRAIGIGRWVNTGLLIVSIAPVYPRWGEGFSIITYPRRQNDRGRGVVQLRDIKWLRDEVCRIELVELDLASGLDHRLLQRRGHVVRLSHAHSAELLGHLRNVGCRLSICRYWGLRQAWVGAIHRLLISHGLDLWLLGVGTIGTSGRGLTTERSIGARAKIKGLASIGSLLLSSSGGWKGRTLRGDGRLLLRRIRRAVDRLAVPFLRRITPLWSCHGGCDRDWFPQ